MKQCGRCGETKPLSAFYKKRDGHATLCAECCRRQKREKKPRSTDLGMGEDLTGRKFHMATVLSFSYSENHKYYWECHCDCGQIFLGRADALRSGRTKSCGCYGNYLKGLPRLPDNQAQKNELCYRYRKNAESRGLPFDIPFDTFIEYTQKPCFYCGVEHSSTMWSTFKNRHFSYNGIDRIDSSLGYVEGNIVTSCHQCNFAKSDYTLDEFYDWVERVHSRIKEAA